MKRSEILLMILQVPVDFLMLMLAALTAYAWRFSDWAIAWRPIMFALTVRDFVHISLWVAFSWLIIFAFVGLYSVDANRRFARDVGRVVLACSTGLAAIALYVLFSQEQFDSRFLIVAGWLAAIVFVSFGRLLMRGLKGLLYRLGIGQRRIVVIGQDAVAEAMITVMRERPELGYRVVAVFANFTEAANKLKKITCDEMLFANARAHEEEALAAVDFCNEHHLIFKYSADLFATYSANMSVNPLAGVPVVELRRTPLDGWGRVTKRLCDIVVSLVAIVIFSPILVVCALAVWLETGRPIIYKNQRVGIRGLEFFTYKFRSMYQKDSTGPQFGEAGKKAELRERTLIKKQNTKTGPIYKIAADPRVTKVGNFLRRWSLDELPQFFNVLGGSMSVVGPRPHQPREVGKYDKPYRKVLTIKPGITGLAQISGRSDLSFEEEMRLDILYIEKWNLLLDIIIILKTPFVLFKKRKAL